MKTLADLVDHIRDAAAGRSDLIQVTGGETLSTNDFIGTIHGLVLALDDADVRAGQRVAVVAQARPEWLIIDLACHLLGAVSVPLAPGRGTESLGFALRNAGARWLFYDAQTRGAVRSLAASMATAPRLVALDPANESPDRQTFTRLVGGMAQRRGEIPLSRFSDRAQPDDIATLVYTDDPRPAGLVFAHRTVLAALEGVEERCDLRSNDRVLSMLDPHHLLQRLIDLASLRHGASLLFGRPDDDAATTTALPTVVSASADWFANAANVTDSWLGPGLRMAMAATPLDAPTREATKASDRVVLQGMSAASTLLTLDSVADLPPGAVGRTLAGVALRTADDGQLLARGPAVPEVLWQRRNGGRYVGRDGWLRTGRWGTVDANGFLFPHPRDDSPHPRDDSDSPASDR